MRHSQGNNSRPSSPSNLEQIPGRSLRPTTNANRVRTSVPTGVDTTFDMDELDKIEPIGLRDPVSESGVDPFLTSGSTYTGKTLPMFEEVENLDKDQINYLIIEYAKTLTVEAAGKVDKTYQAKINGTDVGDKKPFEQNGFKVPYETAGRLIFESVVALLKSCSKELYWSVMANVDVNSAIDILTSKLHSNNERFEELESNVTRSVGNLFPEEYFKAEAELNVSERRRIIKFLYCRDWDKLQLEIKSKADANTPMSEDEIRESLTACRRTWNIQQIFRGEGKWFGSELDEDVLDAIDEVPRNVFAKFKSSGSEFYKQYEIDISTLTTRTQNEARSNYVESYREYKESLAKINKDKELYGKMKVRRNELETIKQINIAFSTAITLIVEKLKNAVKSYPEIVAKLHGTVKLAQTPDVLHDPYNSSSLTGMLEIMRSEFVKASLVMFKHKLLEVMNLRLNKDQMDGDPNHGIQSIQRHINAWKSMQLFKYLTEDIFWVVVFLRQYSPESEIYQRGIERTMEYIHRVQTGELGLRNTNLLHPGMPILSDLFEWLNRVYAQSIDYTSQNKKKKSFNPSSSSNQGNNGKNDNNKGQTVSRFHKNYPNNEIQWANAAVESTFVQKQMKPAAASYDREVLRKENIGIKNESNGQWHLYTATKLACTSCTSPEKTHPKPFCYLGKCKKCGFFGHATLLCLQTNKNE